MTQFDLQEQKLIIRSLVLANAKPITIFELRRAYRESEGRDLPFSAMGYTSALDFLHAIKDTVVVLPDNTLKAAAKEETKHLEAMIDKQRCPKKKGCRSRHRTSSKGGLYYRNTSYSSYQYNIQRANRPRHQTGALRASPCSGSRTNYSYNQYSNANKGPHRQYRPDLYAISNSSSSSDVGSSSGLDDSFDIVLADKTVDKRPDSIAEIQPQVTVAKVDFAAVLTPQLIKNLRDIIREHPEGILCSQLSQRVREKFGVPLNHQKYGFASMIQLVDAIPQIFTLKDQENNDWLLLDSQKSPESHVLRKTNGTAVSAKVCEKIREVAKTLSYPMTTNVFDSRYENIQGKSICEEAEGFPNVDSILTSIGRSFICLDNIKGVYYVVPFKQSRQNALDIGSESEDEVVYPNNMLSLGGEVPPLENFSDAIAPVMEVKLGEIYGPHKFYMLSTYLKNSYEHLDEHIQLFYANSKHLALTDLPVKKGLYCVAPYLDKWHRAVITRVDNSTHVIVFLIDFGTYLTLPKTDLRFLHKDFASIPRLALRATLHGVKPVGNSEKFSREANIKFFILSSNKTLTAHVKEIDFEQQKYSVSLAEDSVSISIEKKLVEENLAEHRTNELNRPDKVPDLSATSPSCLSDPSNEIVRHFQELNVNQNNLSDKPINVTPRLSIGALIKNALSRQKVCPT